MSFINLISYMWRHVSIHILLAVPKKRGRGGGFYGNTLTYLFFYLPPFSADEIDSWVSLPIPLRHLLLRDDILQKETTAFHDLSLSIIARTTIDRGKGPICEST